MKTRVVRFVALRRASARHHVRVANIPPVCGKCFEVSPWLLGLRSLEKLNAIIDSIETLILLQLVFHQIYCGTDETVQELLDKLEHGQLYPPIDVVVDARSVSDAISASDVCTPQESSLRLHLIAIRDRLSRGLLRSLSWGDTRDMLADALTKGGVDRAVIRKAMQGEMTMHDMQQNKPKTRQFRHAPTNDEAY